MYLVRLNEQTSEDTLEGVGTVVGMETRRICSVLPEYWRIAWAAEHKPYVIIPTHQRDYTIDSINSSKN